MIQIEYPPYQPLVKMIQGKKFLFDSFRKKWVFFTPEEWVRQHFLQYLIQEKKYPARLIAVEKEMLLNEQKRRFDILVYNSLHQPWMVIECKQMDEPLSEKVLQQALQYNLVLQCQYLVVTNGTYTAAYHLTNGSFEELFSLPDYV
jgi:hypothetical protein